MRDLPAIRNPKAALRHVSLGSVAVEGGGIDSPPLGGGPAAALSSRDRSGPAMS
jgi:hypothetical protein